MLGCFENSMQLKGNLEGQPATVFYDTNGFDFFDIIVLICEVYFNWDQLSSLQQVHILRQLKGAFPTSEENYN